MKDLNHKNTLLIGIGNSGRKDDGLGWKFLDYIGRTEKFKGKIEYRYQLQIEDAELIQHFDTVIFVDAWQTEKDKAFEWGKCEPVDNLLFSSHELNPETVVYMCHDLYQKFPNCYCLKIKGYSWKLELGLSKKAIINLAEAYDYFMPMLNDYKEMDEELLTF